MAGIFPNIPNLNDQDKAALPILKDIAIDFETGEPIIEHGDFVIVEKDEAIKVWCYYALKTNEDEFPMFPSNFGNKLEELVGTNYVDEDKYAVQKKVTECLLRNKYIKSVDSVEAEFDEDGILTGNIYITTIYSKGVEVNV